MAESRRQRRREERFKDRREERREDRRADERKKHHKSATDEIKETTKTGECPVITMSPAAAQMSVPPDASAMDPSVWSTGPGEAVQYHYERQGQYAEEFAQEQAKQAATPAGVSVAGPGQG